MKIAVAGKAGSGKTSVANILVEAYGFERHSLAARLKQLCELHEQDDVDLLPEFLEIINPLSNSCGQDDLDALVSRVKAAFSHHEPVEGKNRGLLQEMGTDVFRAFDHEVWIAYLVEHVRMRGTAYNYVVDDVRFVNEVEGLHDAGWFTVYCHVPEATRLARLPGGMTEEQQSHPSEAELSSIPIDSWDMVLDTAVPMHLQALGVHWMYNVVSEAQGG